MGGHLIRHEPIDHSILLQDVLHVPLFRQYGWLDYFLKLRAFNTDIAEEFTRTFHDEEAKVRGITVNASIDRIVEVTGLPQVGEPFPRGRDARSDRAEFTRPNDPQQHYWIANYKESWEYSSTIHGANETKV